MKASLIRHPATYNKVLFPIFADILSRYGANRILDPFAGKGNIFKLWDYLPNLDIAAVEIEPKWAACHPLTSVGDVLDLPEVWTDRYHAVVTSLVFGNRMSDHHKAMDGSKRNTYTHCLGEELQPNNCGKLQFGEDYCVFEQQAMIQMRRVLKDGNAKHPPGLMIIEVKDFYKTIKRKGKKITRRVRVTLFHRLCAANLGFTLLEAHKVYVPGNRQGANRHRMEYSTVLVFRKGTTHQAIDLQP